MAEILGAVELRILQPSGATALEARWPKETTLRSIVMRLSKEISLPFQVCRALNGPRSMWN